MSHYLKLLVQGTNNTNIVTDQGTLNTYASSSANRAALSGFETQSRQGYQWTHKKDLCPPKFRKKILISTSIWEDQLNQVELKQRTRLITQYTIQGVQVQK